MSFNFEKSSSFSILIRIRLQFQRKPDQHLCPKPDSFISQHNKETNFSPLIFLIETQKRRTNKKENYVTIQTLPQYLEMSTVKW